MTKLAILTPTYRPDFEYFRDLHTSVLRHTSDDVVHHIIVPSKDVPVFAGLASSRLKVHTTHDFLPPSFLSTYSFSQTIRGLPGLSLLSKVQAVNLKRPWPPVRGWILQQIVKLAAVDRLEADVVLIADSDVVLVRPIAASDFMKDGVVRFYRRPKGVSSEMVRHIEWHRTARKLLGLPETAGDFSRDYIAAFIPWDATIVRRIRERISSVSHHNWVEAIAREIEFSECIVYGTYVDYIASDRDRSFTSSNSLCCSYWDTKPINISKVKSFVESISDGDLAVQIQSTSRTPLEVRHSIIAAAEERFA